MGDDFVTASTVSNPSTKKSLIYNKLRNDESFQYLDGWSLNNSK